MMARAPSSFLTLPQEVILQILDNLDVHTVFWSLQNVCTRFNTILDSYNRYQVILCFVFIYPKLSIDRLVKHTTLELIKYVYTVKCMLLIIENGKRSRG